MPYNYWLEHSLVQRMWYCEQPTTYIDQPCSQRCNAHWTYKTSDAGEASDWGSEDIISEFKEDTAGGVRDNRSQIEEYSIHQK